MAKPKVFVSSTCYDLGEVRDALSNFIRSYGFEPVLSEHGGVFYHPDLHTHESCMHEVGNCQLFILIIGGRFGGKYLNEPEKSITNAEYEAALKQNIPVFTYIKQDVMDNHNLYQSNRKESFSADIKYPAIDKPTDAVKIFEFINRVRRAEVNNSYESFSLYKNIESHLRKQWAGMFYDFLKNRNLEKQISTTNETLSEIQKVNDKMETLIKEVYKVVDVEHANGSIQRIEILSMAEQFIEHWTDGREIPVTTDEINTILPVDPLELNWKDYLIAIGLISDNAKDGLYESTHILSVAGFVGIFFLRDKDQKILEENFENGFKNLTEVERKALLKKHFIAC